jgi:hypothetical protein
VRTTDGRQKYHVSTDQLGHFSIWGHERTNIAFSPCRLPDPVSPRTRCDEKAIRTGKAAIFLPGIGFDLLLGEVAELDAVCAVDLLADNGDLLFDGEVQIIKELEFRFAFAGCNQSFRELTGASAALSPVTADDCSIRTTDERLLPDELELCGGVRPMFLSACRTESWG